jgi:FHA domain
MRCGSVFSDDPSMVPRHARVRCRAGHYTLRDLASVNGIYVRLRKPVELRDRDVVLIGQQVLRFQLLREGEQPLGPASQNGVRVFGNPEAHRFARLVQRTNGTAIRIRGEHVLRGGDEFRMGRHLFRFEAGSERSASAGCDAR